MFIAAPGRVGCQVASILALIAATAILSAQTTTQPVVRPEARPILRTPDASSVPRAPKLITPYDKLRAPFLPQQHGCFHLVDNAWQPVACATPEYIRTHYIPPPVLANSIQSTAHNVPIILRPGVTPRTYTAPFVWGSVTVDVTSNPVSDTETNVYTSPKGVVTRTPNAFSIQTNTNFFPCSTCKSGSPFALTSGVANSASQPGDTGWVQFVYQQFESGKSGNSRLCVWNVDVTVANNTANNAGYAPTCVYPSATYPMAPVAGPGAAIGAAEVIGYVQCPNASSKAGCTLWVVAQLPWAAGSGWWSISAPDSMGLAGNWTNVSGTMLGAGGASQAIFTGTQMQNVVRGYSCYTAPQSSTGYTPQACTPPPVYSILGRGFDLTASPASYYPTGESSNFTNGPVTFTCAAYDCWLSYGSSN
jgi:hypothetical protein